MYSFFFFFFLFWDSCIPKFEKENYGIIVAFDKINQKNLGVFCLGLKETACYELDWAAVSQKKKKDWAGSSYPSHKKVVGWDLER